MTNLRTAAQQALEALEYAQQDRECPSTTRQAITALRAALAEPVPEPEPGEYHGWVLREVLFDNGEPVGHREPVQEPVAWLYEVGTDRTLHWHKPPLYGTPLYTAPPQRKPLTADELWSNDEIMSLNADFGWHMETIRMFARAIERAHGIT